MGQLLDVTIDPSVIDPADPAETAATIADLVLAAVRDAWDSAVDLQQRQLGALSGLGGGFGGPPAGFDLSSLGLPGLGGQPVLEYNEDEDDEDDEDLDEDGEDDEDFDDDDEDEEEDRED